MSNTATTMAETPDSDPPNPNNASPENSSSSSRRSTMPGIKRLIITLSVLLPFLIALPFLLKSTEIYRSPLPFTSINSLSDRILPEPPSPPCHLQAVFLRSDAGDRADELARLISEEVDKRIKSGYCGSCGGNHVVSVVVDSGDGGCVRSGDSFWKCGDFGLPGLWKSDVFVDEMLCEAIGRGGRSYTVVVAERDREEEEEEVRIVVGKYRHAWVKGNVGEDDAVLLIADIFVKYFVNGGREEEGFVARRKGEFVPVGLDGSLVLSFSLLNAEPDDWVYDWSG